MARVNYTETSDGKTIEQFNVYDLRVGRSKHKCPKCHHTRKNKTDLSLIVDWETHIGTCFNGCGSFPISSFEKKVYLYTMDWFIDMARKKGIQSWEKSDSELYRMYIKWKKENWEKIPMEYRMKL